LLSSDWVDVRGVSGGNSDLLDRRKTKQLLVTGAVFDVTTTYLPQQFLTLAKPVVTTSSSALA
jgi:hypothetical protein